MSDETQHRVMFGKRSSKIYDSFKSADASRKVELVWSGRSGVVQERLPGGEWQRVETKGSK